MTHTGGYTITHLTTVLAIYLATLSHLQLCYGILTTWALCGLLDGVNWIGDLLLHGWEEE
jgi:hypothetical protein